MLDKGVPLGAETPTSFPIALSGKGRAAVKLAQTATRPARKCTPTMVEKIWKIGIRTRCELKDRIGSSVVGQEKKCKASQRGSIMDSVEEGDLIFLCEKQLL